MTSHCSPDEFLRKSDLNNVLQAAINAAYVSQSANPVAFVAEYLAKQSSLDTIESVTAQDVIDGSGSCSLQVTLRLTNGTTVTAQSAHNNHLTQGHPSTSRVAVFKTDRLPTQSTDAKELRKQPFSGNGLKGPVGIINSTIASGLVGQSVSFQERFDQLLAALDKSSNFATIGSQCAATLSIAASLANASSSRKPPFIPITSQYFALSGAPRTLEVPSPVVTLFSVEPKWLGKVRVLEVCLLPSDRSVAIGIQQCLRVVEEAQQKLQDEGQPVLVNLDGGLKFNGSDSLPALLDFTEECIKEAGLVPGQDLFIGLVFDAGYCYKAETSRYSIVEGMEMSAAQVAEFVATTVKERKSVIYVEDPLHDKDMNEMKRLMFRSGNSVAVVGNNLLAGNLDVFKQVAKDKAVNVAAIRLNDAGTVSKAIALGQAFQGEYKGGKLCVAGEATLGYGSFLADFATGVGASYLRGGGLLRPDHAAAYSRLIDIERELEQRGLRATGVAGASRFPDFSQLALPPAPTEPVQEVNVKDAKKKK